MSDMAVLITGRAPYTRYELSFVTAIFGSRHASSPAAKA
jgi:hypothetical protein